MSEVPTRCPQSRPRPGSGPGIPPSGRTYTAIFATPRDARTVSPKAHLVDADGNITDQTVIGAYPLH